MFITVTHAHTIFQGWKYQARSYKTWYLSIIQDSRNFLFLFSRDPYNSGKRYNCLSFFKIKIEIFTKLLSGKLFGYDSVSINQTPLCKISSSFYPYRAITPLSPETVSDANKWTTPVKLQTHARTHTFIFRVATSKILFSRHMRWK